MEAKDLRIGNITSAGVVSEILQDRFYVHDGESSLKSTWFDIKPAPLTEEWLLKFGFQVRYTIGHSAQYYINENPVTHDWMLSILWLEGDNCPFYKNGHHKIKYVHQLQNLYFALTGEELTYTQP